MAILFMGLVFLLAFILPIAIIVLIVQAIIKKDKNKKYFDNVIRNIYIYLILIISLIMIISCAITVFSTGLDVLLPEQSTSSSSYYNEEWVLNRNMTSMFTVLSAVIVCVPIFVYHSKLAKKDREEKKLTSEVDKIN